MSYTSTYALFKTRANTISEHRNGHGSGPAIWDYISMKLQGKPFRSYGGDGGEFWALWKDARLTRSERAVLLSTYDYAFIELSHLSEFAAACDQVSALIIERTDWTWNHFAAIGADARNLIAKHDHRCLGMAIGCTSVCDPWEQESPENMNTWGIYEVIEKLKKAA